MRGFDDDDAGAGSRLPLLRSPLIAPPFAHGFSTRAGGVSAAPFDTLNLGARWGDAPAHVEENRRRLLRAAGVAGPLYVARQVHGAAVVRVRAGDDPAAIARIEADALFTDDAGVGARGVRRRLHPGAGRRSAHRRRRRRARRLARHRRGRAARGGARARRRVRRARRTICASRWARRSARAASRSAPRSSRAFEAALGGARGGRRRAAVAARRGRQVARRSEGREPPAAGTRRRRSRGDRRRRPTAPPTIARASSPTAATATHRPADGHRRAPRQ